MARQLFTDEYLKEKAEKETTAAPGTEAKTVIQPGIITEVIQDLSSPKYAFHVANELKRFVKEQGLTVDIQQKPYALVEAWQFCGAQFGFYPIMTEIVNESTYQPVTFEWVDKFKNKKKKDTYHYKYRATVECRRYSDDKVVSRGVMVCCNDEHGKHEFAEYAIMSMTQTRAEGKAWRLLLGWVMKAAGFEATPFEEMDDERKEFFDNCPTPDEKDGLMKLAYSAVYHQDNTTNNEKKLEAIAMIHGCVDYDLFHRIENRLRDLQPSIHDTSNPSQQQIKEHLKKSL